MNGIEEREKRNNMETIIVYSHKGIGDILFGMTRKKVE